MDVPVPDLHLTDSGVAPLTIESVGDRGRFTAALVMRRTFARGAPAAELLFAFAHVAALLRAPTVVRFGLPSPGLLALGLTVVEGLGKLPVASADRTVRTAVSRLRRRLDRAELARLKELVRALAARSEPPDLRRWLAATDLTAARAALVVTGDLRAALAVIGRQDTTRGGLPAEERVKDLLAFAVSDRHFVARQALALEGAGSDGVAIAIRR
jgi:hypothetical protein